MCFTLRDETEASLAAPERLREKTLWDLLQEEIAERGDTSPIVCSLCTEAELRAIATPFELETTEGFTAWTETRVYFLLIYDCYSYRIHSVPRSPTKELVLVVAG